MKCAWHAFWRLQSGQNSIAWMSCIKYCCRVAQDPKAFNITEIAQICGGCGRLRFDNNKLNAALTTNILAMTDSELNPRAVLNVVCALHRIGLTNPEVCSFLVRFILLAN